MNGIYCYIDKENTTVVYIGQDKNIHQQKRHKDHLDKYNYNNQQINRVLQNNPQRYEYLELIKGNFTQNELNNLEISLIASFNPKFNYTKGGKVLSGENHPSFKNYATLTKNGIIEGNQMYAVRYYGEVLYCSKFKRIVEKCVNALNNDKISKNDVKTFCKEETKKLGNRLTNEFRLHSYKSKNRKKRTYTISYNSKILKRSVSEQEICNWFYENYPNEELIVLA